ncbi:N-acetyltransferase [uncultured Meiothermus sp.]|jgi:putative acetyltransferase|uniref:GNAT family N-acetyltransferase n=1 Tax=uncultured Meiothermus sp. TaxID=157471 RepID=UPI00263A16C8|nr:N-acetyltransferase [uncultured Meiothermus sp.]
MMEVRPERPDEYEAVEQIHTLAFGTGREAKVVARTRQSLQYTPELSLVAVLKGRPVGHILFSQVGLEDRQGVMRKVVVLGPLAIHPEFQNLGTGKRLVEEGLARLEARGVPLVLVRGHAHYYPRFGFVPSVQMDIHPPFAIAQDEYMARPLSAYTPDYRGMVRYPAAFAEVGYPVEFGL